MSTQICIEIDAHAWILLVQLFSKDSHLTEDMFATWLMSSQPCEQTFRTSRSMTITQSTVVNFSMLKILGRLNRIQFMQDVKCELNFNFARTSCNRESLSKEKN